LIDKEEEEEEEEEKKKKKKKKKKKMMMMMMMTIKAWKKMVINKLVKQVMNFLKKVM
jgi:uncharacterized lipoprotein YddW (UPF0748 family)